MVLVTNKCELRYDMGPGLRAVAQLYKRLLCGLLNKDIPEYDLRMTNKASLTRVSRARFRLLRGLLVLFDQEIVMV